MATTRPNADQPPIGVDVDPVNPITHWPSAVDAHDSAPQDLIGSLDAHVRAVASMLGVEGRLVAEVGGTGVLQIELGRPANPDDPVDRAGIDPPDRITPRPVWWVELAGGIDARISELGIHDDPASITHWVTTQMGAMREGAMAEDIAQPPDEPTVWFLSVDELAATKTKMDQLNRRASRNGFTGTVEVHAVPSTRSHTPGPGAATVTMHGFDVTITGEPPRYQGWQFVAVVDTLPAPAQAAAALNAANVPGIVVRYLPGAENLDHEWIRAGECDHCHTTRGRSSVLILRNEGSGETKQVGRSCVKDFLGWSTIPVLIDPDQAERAITRGGGIEGCDWDVTSVLTYSWAVIETDGWVPASSAGDRTATRDLVAEAIAGHGKDAETLRAAIAGKLGEGQLMAPRIITTLSEAFADATGGYEANLAAILRSGQVHPRKHLGLAVSAVNAWRRQQEHVAADQARAQARQADADRAATQHHVGVVGEPITMTGTVTVRRSIEGYRWNSPSQVLLVVDCGDAVAKMITSAAWAYQVKPGDQLAVRGSVKAHELFNDVPQTVLKRPKQIPLSAAEPVWETVTPVAPQSRFQEAPLATHPPLARPVAI